MPLSPSDQNDLLLPLLEGARDTPPWRVFMNNLTVRMGAVCGLMHIGRSDEYRDPEPLIVWRSGPGGAQRPDFDLPRLETIGLYPGHDLRPGRVYALDELLAHDRPEQLVSQREALHAMRIADGRYMRVTAPGQADARLAFFSTRESFTASSVATLSALGPLLAAGLRTYAAMQDQRIRTTIAESALARLGVGQVAFDAEGHVLAADAEAEATLPFSAAPDLPGGRRLLIAPEAMRALQSACAELAAGQGEGRVHIVSVRDGLALLLQPADFAAAIGTLRLERRENPQNAIFTLRATLGLSEREAALAHGLSVGETLIEAGRRLRLTDETARNYSKRIYEKTGARGQADLVRIILTGLAPLA